MNEVGQKLSGLRFETMFVERWKHLVPIVVMSSIQVGKVKTMNEITENEINRVWSNMQEDTETTVSDAENVKVIVAYIRQEREKPGKLSRQTDSQPLALGELAEKLGFGEIVKAKTPTIRRRV